MDQSHSSLNTSFLSVPKDSALCLNILGLVMWKSAFLTPKKVNRNDQNLSAKIDRLFFPNSTFKPFMSEYVSVADVLQSMIEATEPDAQHQIDDLEEMLKLSEIPETYNMDGREVKTFSIFGKTAYLDLYSKIGRKSWNARSLEASLNNARVNGDGPRWYEFAQTGLPRLDPNAAQVAQIALQALSKEFSLAVSAHLSGASSPLKLSWDKAAGAETAHMLKVIGFEKTALIAFLDQQNLPHRFSQAPLSMAQNFADQAPTRRTVLKSLTPSKIETLGAQHDLVPDRSSSASSLIPTKVLTHRVDEGGNGTGRKLQKSVFEKVTRDIGSTDPSAIKAEVWLRLLEIARLPDGQRPRFLKQHKGGKRIEYNGEGSTGFDKKSLSQNIDRWIEEKSSSPNNPA